MYCAHCGNQLEPRFNSCLGCGNPIGTMICANRM